MKKMFVCTMLAVAFLLSRTMAQTPPSAESILARTDQNAVSGNKIILSAMTIHGRRDSRSISSKSWIQGKDKAFTEYLAPAREKGIKMLKLGDQLWTYSPDADRTISISGHMLRQSVMGSDLSYEDMLEDRELQTIYNARVVGEETVLERPCWVLELTSKGEEVAYYSRKVWVDKERFVVLKEEMYAKSNKLLKTLEVKSVIRIQGRWVQNFLVFKDVLKGGDGTEFKITAIEFEAAIPEYIFSKASLRK
jgi:outer membrane lipoprotein-sorting protein